MRLQGKTAVITGGARGIGAAIAEGYAKEGARVCVADLNFADADALASKIGNGSFAYALNVTKMDEIKACVAECEKRMGGIDILVNNAAVFDMAPWGEITEKSYDFVFGVNVKGLIFMLQEVAESMKNRGKGGKIINFASQALPSSRTGSTSTASRRASSTRRCGSMLTVSSPSMRTVPSVRRSALWARAFPLAAWASLRIMWAAPSSLRHPTATTSWPRPTT